MKPEEAIKQIEEFMVIDDWSLVYLPDLHDALELAIEALEENERLAKSLNEACELLRKKRPHGEWEALGFQQGYAFCRCSNCHKTMKLHIDSKNEFCCIADIRKKVVSCMYCGSDNRKRGEAE